MRVKHLAPLAFLGLVACQTGPTLMPFKPGTTYADRQLAFDECKIESLRMIPQSMSTEVSGGYYNPGTIQCSTVGTSTICNRVGAIDIPATSQTYDENQGLRDRFIVRCLEGKGIQLLERPVCPTEAERRSAHHDPQPADPALVKCNSGVPLDS